MRSPLNNLFPSSAPARRRTFRLPGLVLAGIVLLVLFAPLISPADPRHAVPTDALQPPSQAHPLGTDQLGRDVLSRTLWGGRTTLGVAAAATAITILPGLAIGLLAGYTGGWVERLLMGLMDTLLAFPNLLLALSIVSLTGTGNMQIAIAVGITGLPAYARMARTAVKELRHALFVEAARSLGADHRQILRAHILPNVLDALLSFAGISLSWAILNGSALAFLGFGGDPATPDWGAMLNEGRAAFRIAPWIGFPPGIAIMITIFAINRLADAWQDEVLR